jgi:hypothetical protein
MLLGRGLDYFFLGIPAGIVGVYVAKGGIVSSGAADTYDFVIHNVRPTADISTTGWLRRRGSTHWEMVVDSADNTSESIDQIYAMKGISSGLLRIDLSGITDPGVDWGHVLEYVGEGSYTVTLFQGTTEIISFQENDVEETEHSQLLTASVVAQITDYSNLYVEVEFT